MIQTTVTPIDKTLSIQVPDDYVGEKIHVLLYKEEELTVTVEAGTNPKTMKDFWGILSPEVAEELQKYARKSRDEWDRDIY